MTASPHAECHAWIMEKKLPPESGFQLRDTRLALPEAQPGQAVVEIAGCGVCGTDLGFFYDGIPTVTNPPLALGHEASGTVVSGSPELLHKKVLLPTIIPCRRCELCTSGRANICLSQRMLGRSYGSYGGFSSHIVVPESELCIIPEGTTLPVEHLAVVTDAVATPYQACRQAHLTEGDKVIIIGAAGGLGVYATQWARHLGASLVVGIGRSREKLSVIEEYGLDLPIALRDEVSGNAVRSVRHAIWSFCRDRKLNPKHSWKILEMSGTRAGQELALELLTYASKAVLVGFGQFEVPYQFSKLMAFDSEVAGSWGCDPHLYPSILEKVLSGDIAISPFVETRPMSRIQEALAELRSGRGSVKRLVLTPDWPRPERGQTASP